MRLFISRWSNDFVKLFLVVIEPLIFQKTFHVEPILNISLEHAFKQWLQFRRGGSLLLIEVNSTFNIWYMYNILMIVTGEFVWDWRVWWGCGGRKGVCGIWNSRKWCLMTRCLRVVHYIPGGEGGHLDSQGTWSGRCPMIHSPTLLTLPATHSYPSHTVWCIPTCPPIYSMALYLNGLSSVHALTLFIL